MGPVTGYYNLSREVPGSIPSVGWFLVRVSGDVMWCGNVVTNMQSVGHLSGIFNVEPVGSITCVGQPSSPGTAPSCVIHDIFMMS